MTPGGRTDENETACMRELGAVYLPKPFAPHTLVEMLALPRLLHSAKTQSP